MEPVSQMFAVNANSSATGGANVLLAALSDEALSIIKPHLRSDEFRPGDLLWDDASAECQVYFPHTGLISIAAGLPEDSIEVASVSREGAAGLHESVDHLPGTRATVLIGGTFSCLPARRFAELENQNAELAAVGVFCRDWILLQAQHMAVCNASHSAEARFARWLLLATERMESDMLPMTQEHIAALLGIRRTTVTLIAQKLQNMGIIRYSRGKIAIQDHDSLHANACDCYRALGRKIWPSQRIRTAAAERGGGGPRWLSFA
jgi:hypothetical protein